MYNIVCDSLSLREPVELYYRKCMSHSIHLQLYCLLIIFICLWGVLQHQKSCLSGYVILLCHCCKLRICFYEPVLLYAVV